MEDAVWRAQTGSQDFCSANNRKCGKHRSTLLRFQRVNGSFFAEFVSLFGLLAARAHGKMWRVYICESSSSKTNQTEIRLSYYRFWDVIVLSKSKPVMNDNLPNDYFYLESDWPDVNNTAPWKTKASNPFTGHTLISFLYNLINLCLNHVFVSVTDCK